MPLPENKNKVSDIDVNKFNFQQPVNQRPMPKIQRVSTIQQLIEQGTDKQHKPDVSNAVIGGIASAQDLLKTLISDGSSFEEALSPRAVEEAYEAPKQKKKSAIETLEKHPSVVRICMTGGPCAGKTTAIADLTQSLTQLGMKVLVVPEAATTLMKGGAFIVSSEFTDEQGLQFQKTLMRTQISLENSFTEIANEAAKNLKPENENNKVVLLIDRGLMDGSAFITEEKWQELLTGMEVKDVSEVREDRYDAVIHMVTSADGAKDFYVTQQEGESRYEDTEAAIDQDMKLRKAYSGMSPHQYFIIENREGGFKEKIRKTKEAAFDVLGTKGATKFDRKYILKKNIDGEYPIDLNRLPNSRTIDIYETFIEYQTPLGEVVWCCVEHRKSEAAGPKYSLAENISSDTYTLKVRMLSNGELLSTKRALIVTEYERYLSQVKSGTNTLHRKRVLVDENKRQNQEIMLDYYPEIDGQPLLAIFKKGPGENDSQLIPDYLSVLRDITDERQYSSKIMSKDAYYMDAIDKQYQYESSDLPIDQNYQREQNIEQFSIWKDLSAAPSDPVFGLINHFQTDNNPKKVLLGVGVYRDENGLPHVFDVVRKAEQLLLDQKLNKDYAYPDGIPSFRQKSIELAYGENHPGIEQDRIASMQTVSGTGALRIGFELLKRFFPRQSIQIPNVTWSLHHNIIQDCGFQESTFRFYDPTTKGLDIDGMLEDLESMKDEQILLIQTSCQNPSGVDPTNEEWQQIFDVVKRKKHFVFFDSAYQGFGSDDLAEDTYSLKLFSEDYDRIMLAQSFSKNFGLYGERTGCLSMVCSDTKEKEVVQTRLKETCLPIYSNPPIHGARIVDLILGDDKLTEEWKEELKTVSRRLQETRLDLVQKLNDLCLIEDECEAENQIDWSYIAKQKGMFAYTGLAPELIKELRKKYSIYMPTDGRISIASINHSNIDYIVQAIFDVTHKDQLQIQNEQLYKEIMARQLSGDEHQLLNLNFSEEEFLRLFKIFQKLDADMSGSLEPQEFKRIASIGMNPLLLRVIDVLDKNQDGSISFLEFMQGLNSIQSQSSNEADKLKFAFELYDINHDGFISEKELFDVIKITSYGKLYEDEQLHTLISNTMEEADLDKDGKISFEEFQRWIQSQPVSESMK